MKRGLAWGVAGAAWLAAGMALAGEGADGIRFSGFATVAAVRLDTPELQYRTRQTQPVSLSGQDWQFGADSVAGLQLDWAMAPAWRATVQLVAQQREDADLALNWAYVQWQATPGLAWRAGRIATTTLLDAEARDVGYARAWVRPPGELYGLAATNAGDGAELRWEGVAMGGTLRARAALARNSVELSRGATRADSGVVALEWARPGLRLIAGGGYGRVSVGTPQLDRLIDAASAAGYAAAAEGYRMSADNRYGFASAGMRYETTAWAVQAEYALRKIDLEASPRIRAYYLAVEWRVGDWTPFGYVAEASCTGPVVEDRMGAFNPAFTGVLRANRPCQRSAAAGVRWDIASNVDLKAQFETVRREASSIGLFAETAAGASIREARAVSLAVDLVF